MICGNCGFQNQPGDEFCGSCGKFLEWATEGTAEGQPDGVPQTEPTDTLRTVQPDSQAPVPIPVPVPEPGTTVTTGAGAGPQTGITPVPQLVRCEKCGTANESTRAFCLNCRAPLKKTGTTGGRFWGGAGSSGVTEGDRGINTKYVVAGAVLLGLALLGAAVVFGGFLGPGTPNRSPGASSVAANGSPVATVLTTGVPGSAATTAPDETTGPTASTDPSAPPQSTATPGSGGRFSCETQHMDAGTTGRWSVTGARAGRRSTHDYLALTLEPRGQSVVTAAVDAELVAPAEVRARFGVDPPQTGDIALVLVFNEEVGAVEFEDQPALRALREYQVVRTGPRSVHVVIGVNGEGCFDLQSAAWSGSASIQLIVEIQR